MDSIYSLFDVASAWEVPFGISQYAQWILHEPTSVLCIPFIFADNEKCGDLVVACDGLLSVMESLIIHIFHRGYGGALHLTFQIIIDECSIINWGAQHHLYFS